MQHLLSRALATVASVGLAASSGLAQQSGDAPARPGARPPARAASTKPSPWSAGPKLAFARRQHTTSVLPDGSLLMAGGLGAYNSQT